MSDCEKCQALLDAYRDGELDEDDESFITDHLAQCAACQTKWQEMQRLAALLAVWAAEEIEPPADLRQKIFTQLEAQLVVKQQFRRKRLEKALPWLAAAVLLLALLPTTLHLTDKHATNQSAAQLVTLDDTDKEEALSNEIAPELAEEKAQPPEKEAKQKQAIADSPKPPVTVAREEQALVPATGAVSPAENTAVQGTDDGAEAFNDAGQTPMLASSSYPLDEKQTVEQDESENAPELFLRSRMAGAEDVDWVDLQAQTTALQEQYNADLARLQSQYAQEPSEELAQTIKDLEEKLQHIQQKLTAIAAQDFAAYQAADEPNTTPEE